MADTSKGFFSSANDKAWQGNGTYEFRDARTGVVRKLNYIGSEVGGFPGFLNEKEEVVRPPNHQSYVFVGEVGPGKFQLTEAAQRALAPRHVMPTPRMSCRLG